MKLKKIRVGKLVLMVSIVSFLFGSFALVHTPCSEAGVYKEASPEFEVLKKKMTNMFSLPESERKKEPLYQSLLQIEEEDFEKLLELFAGDTEIYQFLLNARELDPYLPSNNWGDWNEQVLTYTPPPGPPPGGRTWSASWRDTAQLMETPVRTLPDLYTIMAAGPGATLPSLGTPVMYGPGATLPSFNAPVTYGPGATLPGANTPVY